MESFFLYKKDTIINKRLQEDSLLLRFGIKAVSSLAIKIFASTRPNGEPIATLSF